MLYLAVHPTRRGDSLNMKFLAGAPNRLAELLPEDAEWAGIVRVPGFDAHDSKSGARAPASRAPFPQIPAFEGRCIRPGIVALPHRTAAGTLRSGASPDAAHRPSRCTASAGTEP